MQKIHECKALFYAPLEKVITSKMPVFYNPVMRLNRDFSVMAIRAFGKVDFADILAGTGVRGIRLLKETKNISSMALNDLNPRFKQTILRNLKLNRLQGKAAISNKDANIFLLESKGFNSIDIDPFGSPNPFLDAATSRIARNGLIFVTSTDTASLSGTYPNTCIRKYWANPLHGPLMHEIGLRILIRRVQLVAADKEKSLKPLFSYFRDHYFRICFIVEKGRKKADLMIEKHKLLKYYEGRLSENHGGSVGPLWSGPLHDNKFLSAMMKNEAGIPQDTKEFLRLLHDEAKVDGLGYLDLHATAKGKKIEKVEKVIADLERGGIKAARSQFCPWGVVMQRQ